MRGLVISGGGSKGAFAGGLVQYLIEEEKRTYDILVGTSTGSLLVPHLALGNIKILKEAYTSVNPKKIFDNSPFKLKIKDDQVNFGINHLNVIKNILDNSKTFGESKNLLNYIRETFSVEHFNILKKSCKDVIITVSNISLNTTEYKSVKDFDYDNFCEWMWASCSYTPFMSLVHKDGYDYADGGLGMNVPIAEAVKRGAKEIDVIILDPKDELTHKRAPSHDPFSLLTNMLSYAIDRVENQNIKIGTFEAEKQGAKVNFYHVPKMLTTNPLIFDKELMNSWWKLGWDFGKNKCAT